MRPADTRAKRITVVGYPRIFNGSDCNALTWFSPSEETRLNQTADLINATTAAVAAAAEVADNWTWEHLARKLKARLLEIG